MVKFDPNVYVDLIARDSEITGIPGDVEDLVEEVNSLLSYQKTVDAALLLFKTRKQQLDVLIPLWKKQHESLLLVSKTKFAKMSIPVDLDTPYPVMTKDLGNKEIKGAKKELKELEKERDYLVKTIREFERL